MPTHALLGATGNTGSAILRTLLSSSPDNDLRVNILVRSQEKLLHKFPALLSSSSPLPIKVFVGPVTDTTLLTECLTSCEIIYNCIATNELNPNQSLSRTAAEAILSSLSHLRESQGREKYICPTMLFNRTIGLNPSIPNPYPAFLDPFITWALDWAFDDLRAACSLYVSAAAAGLDETGLLRYIFMDPPKILEPNGTRKAGYVLINEKGEMVRPALYYADLGDAFVEVAGRAGEFADGAVGVSSRGRVAEGWGDVLEALGLLRRGLIFKIFGL